MRSRFLRGFGTVTGFKSISGVAFHLGLVFGTVMNEPTYGELKKNPDGLDEFQFTVPNTIEVPMTALPK